MQNTAIKFEAGSEQWHAERRLGIGGSDMAAVLGLSKWKTPYQIYLEKIGEAEDQEENWAMAQGKCMEPLLRQHFANTTGLEVRLPTSAIVHPKYSFIRYNPDGLSDPKILAEFKTARFSTEWGESNTDQIPQEYIIQVQTGLACLDFEVAKCSVSIGGGEPKYYEVPRDKELQEMIEEGAAAFWDRVVNRTPPDPVDNEDCSRIFRKVNGKSIIADAEINDAVIDLCELRSKIKEDEEYKETLEVQIKSFMAENEILINSNGVPIITWKQQKGSRRIDGDALRTNYPDIAAAVTNIGDPTRRFLVK